MVSEGEAEAIRKYSKTGRFFDDGDHKPGDIDVLETPGHTSGSASFIIQSPHGKTYLFTGDAFFQWNGRWAMLILNKAGGAKPPFISSLHKLRVLKPDVVMSSGFVGEAGGTHEVTVSEWRQAIDTEITRLKKR